MDIKPFKSGFILPTAATAEGAVDKLVGAIGGLFGFTGGLCVSNQTLKK